MSGIAAVSGQMSSVSAASFVSAGSMAGAAGGAQGADNAGAAGSTAASSFASTVAGLDPSAVGGAPGSTSVQTSALISMAQPNANIQNMAALILSMLLSKSNDDSKDKDDAWKMLAGMAMLGAMANQQGQNVTMMQSTSVVTQAYGADAVAGAAGAAVNMQG